MADAFQTQSKQQTAAASKPVLRDMAEDKLLKQRPKKMARVIKMLDVLTAGDEQLYEYLKAQQAEAAKRVEQAKEDMEMAETPEEAAEFAPDPIDELIAQDVPAVNTFDFEAFKNSLLQTCQDQLADLMRVNVAPERVYARCGVPGCCIHLIEMPSGHILEHIPAGTSAADPGLSKIESIILNDPNVSYVEVYGNRLSVVDNNGNVEIDAL